MRSLLLLAGLLPVLFSMGCVSGIEKAARNLSFRDLRVESRVDVLRPMRFGYVADDDQLTTELLATLNDGLVAKRMREFGELMATNDIVVAELVRDRTVELLGQMKNVSTTTNRGDATLVLSIIQYGFDGLGTKNGVFIPFVTVGGRLVNQEGKTVWSSWGRVHPFTNDDASARFDAYAAKPEMLRQHWQLQVDRAVKKMLAGKKYEVSHLFLGAAPVLKDKEGPDRMLPGGALVAGMEQSVPDP